MSRVFAFMHTHIHGRTHAHSYICVHWIRLLFVSFSCSLDLILDCRFSLLRPFRSCNVGERSASNEPNLRVMCVHVCVIHETYTVHKHNRNATTNTAMREEKRRTHTNTLKHNFSFDVYKCLAMFVVAEIHLPVLQFVLGTK